MLLMADFCEALHSPDEADRIILILTIVPSACGLLLVVDEDRSSDVTLVFPTFLCAAR